MYVLTFAKHVNVFVCVCVCIKISFNYYLRLCAERRRQRETFSNIYKRSKGKLPQSYTYIQTFDSAVGQSEPTKCLRRLTVESDNFYPNIL